MKPWPNDFPPKNGICVLGIPLDNNSSYRKGPALAPDRIRESYFCDSANLWTETGIDLTSLDRIYDIGNVDCSDHHTSFNRITSTVEGLLGRNNRVISLGGDHSVTYPVIKAFAPIYPAQTMGKSQTKSCAFGRV